MDTETIEAVMVTVCERCGCRPDDREAELPCEGTPREPGDGVHVFVELPACRRCGGRGELPWQGRWRSTDPADWDSCDVCEGVGVEGIV